MVISVIEVSNRRAMLLKNKALKKLKEQRKQTRSAMQGYEGSTALDDDDQTTYDDLNLSMVVLNALSDHLLKCDFLPDSWTYFTLGSEFDKDYAPLLRSNSEGDMWVEYFDCPCPKDLLKIIAGNGVSIFDKKAQPAPEPPKTPNQPAQAAPQTQASGSGLMDMIRTRMPNRSQAQYTPRRS